MNLILDASVFISAFQKSEKNHREATEVMALIRAHRISLITHALFYFEVLCTLQRKTNDRTVAMKALAVAKALPVMKSVPIDQRLFESQETLVSQLGLRGADAVYVSIASRYKARLITFDFEMFSRAEKYCIPVEKFLAMKSGG